MKTYTEEELNIASLLFTQEKINIDLAQQLCKGQNIDFDALVEKVFVLSFWKEFFPNKIDKYKRSNTQLKYFFEYCLHLMSFDNTIKKEGSFYSNLKVLKLHEFKRKTFPNGIGQFENLELFYANNEELEYLPESIGDLKNLNTLKLSNTQLKELPNSITKLTKLEGLNIENTKLTSIPENIGALKALKNLNLSYTDIDVLPESIANLKNLKHLYLTCTDVDSLPKGLTTQCKIHVHNLRFFREKYPEYTFV
ncbi:MAG: leucine-rich repeat domain-containing protein [Cytophagales bacterium]|nr:leucine-rich repeat domain-containing protein [Cytophagales bacterium]